MYELVKFDNHAQSETYGKDAYGEFGTILATACDLAIPEPDSQSDPQSPSTHNLSAEKGYA
jgi:hypothetical protein